jgi:hypothetical protein
MRNKEARLAANLPKRGNCRPLQRQHSHRYRYLKRYVLLTSSCALMNSQASVSLIVADKVVLPNAQV